MAVVHGTALGLALAIHCRVARFGQPEILLGIIPGAADIDVVYTSGYDFPRYRGGPMFYADTVERILELQRRFDSQYCRRLQG